jgi:prolyl-tRNA synthetase
MEKSKGDKGISAEKDEFSEWFAQLMLKADLADYTEVSGAIVFKPSAYSIWEMIREECDKRFKKLGVQNAYFPLLIPEKFLNKEKEHVEGFSPEVAWVTQTGDTKLSERLAIRPTSETIMYPSYSKWIRSWRDLPLKLNQWNNVVRWEFKHPVPFMRTREFLWNEGHTAYATEKEALKEEKQIIDAYKDVCENFLALYGVLGRKTEKEKFAGAVFSEKLHYVMPNGKAIEGPCFHHDGQNFAKAYDIRFLDEEGKKKEVFQNTFAITTRMLGVMFAVHSDKKGLILPPKAASNKVVIVPILFEDSKEKVLKNAEEIGKKLSKYDAFVDSREEYKPGFKFNEWELKGIPIRIEIGPRDLEKKQVVLVRRDNLKKEIVKISDVDKRVSSVLETMQKDMFEKSKKIVFDSFFDANTLADLQKAVKGKKIGLTPMCSSRECEDMLKFKTNGAKTLWLDNKKVKAEKCVVCEKKAEYFVYVGKSY